MSCIDQPRRGLLHAAIERGLRYTDITPHLVELGRGAAYEEIGAAARRSGARVVLGTGIVPGISNVIVRAVANTLGGADVIETSLLLSASDASGPGIVRLLREGADDAVRRACRWRRPSSARLQRSARDRVPLAVWTAIGVSVPVLRSGAVSADDERSDGLDEVGHRASEAGTIACSVGSLGAVRLVARERVRNVLAKRRSDRAPNEDAARFALRVDVIHDGRSAHATLVGGPQADAAAAGASATVRALMEDEVSEPGVWMPEQVIGPPGFFSRLCEQGLAVELSTIDDRPRQVSRDSSAVRLGGHHADRQ